MFRTFLFLMAMTVGSTVASLTSADSICDPDGNLICNQSDCTTAGGRNGLCQQRFALCNCEGIEGTRLIHRDCGLNGSNIRFVFTVDNDLTQPVCRVTVEFNDPGCQVLAAAIPATSGWSATYTTSEAIFEPQETGNCLPTASALDGFEFELNQSYCCARVWYWNAQGHSLASELICFDCRSVPVDQRSWGRVKQTYR